MNNNPAEQAIMNAALEVMAEESIGGVRMHLIAEKAGMSQANLHYYYKTKHDLIIELFSKIREKYEADRKVALGKTCKDIDKRLGVFCDQKKHLILDQPAYEYAHFNYWTYGRIDPEVRQMFYDSNEAWRKEMREAIRKYVPGVSEDESRLLSHVMVSMLMGASVQYLNHPGLMDLDAYFALCKEMLLTQIEKYERQAQEAAGEEAYPDSGASNPQKEGEGA